MAQLVERLLLTAEIPDSNPDIGKILSTNCTIEKTKIKKKRPGMAHIKKRYEKQQLLRNVVWELLLDGQCLNGLAAL